MPLVSSFNGFVVGVEDALYRVSEDKDVLSLLGEKLRQFSAVGFDFSL